MNQHPWENDMNINQMVKWQKVWSYFLQEHLGIGTYAGTMVKPMITMVEPMVIFGDTWDDEAQLNLPSHKYFALLKLSVKSGD